MPEIAAIPILGDIIGGIGSLGASLGGALGGAGAAGAGAAGLGEAAAAGAPLDLLSFGGADAALAGPVAAGAGGSALGAGLATEPAFASSALGLSLPGLDTSAAGLGLDALGGAAAGGLGAGGISPSSAGLEGAAYPSGPLGAPAAPASGPITPALSGGPAPLGGGTGAAGLAGPSGIDAAPTIGPAGSGSAASDVTAGAGRAATDTSGFGSFLSNNRGLLTSLGLPLAATAASPLLSHFINPVPQQAGLQQLQQQEASLANQQQQLGSTLTNPLVTGQLPPQAAQEVSNAVNDAVSSTRARYASLGLTGSTMEADAIANIQNQRSAITFNIAQQMATTGQQAVSQASTALGLQDQVYSQLMNAQVAQDTALQQAIARMAAGAALSSASPATRQGAAAANAIA